MFLSLITLAILSAAINYASSCASLGWETREYQDWEKDWCRADFHRCARHLCKINGHNCDDYLIDNTILPELRCKLSNQCYPRTDMLGQYCRRNDDCRNSNYRCRSNRCVHKSTISIPFLNGRRCDKWDSECRDPRMKCDRLKGLCVPKKRGVSRDRCDATPDCAPDYTCVNFRCVYTAGRGVTVSVTFGGGGKRKRCDKWDSECQDSRLKCDRPTGLCVLKNRRGGSSRDRCEATPDCAPDYTCINFRCMYTAGKGIKLSGGSGGSGGKRKRCDKWDSECQDSRLKCDRPTGLCVPKSGGGGRGGGSRDRCEATPDCASDYTCKNFRCVYTAGKGIKLSGGSSGSRSRRKRCDKRDSECQDSRLKCNRAKGECVPKNGRNGKPYRQGKSCTFSPDCGPDYMCYNGDCVLGKLS